MMFAMTDDLDDGLSDIFGDMGRERDPAINIREVVLPEALTHSEPCKKCKGRGSFVGYTGRVVGQCFACKGKGKLTFKTSPEARAASRESAQRRKDREQQERADAAAAWVAEHPAEAKWMTERGARFDFALSMFEAVQKYGHLTERQLAAVRNCMQKDAARDAERAADQARRAEGAQAVDIGPVIACFARAVANGLKRPKLRLDGFTLSLAPAHGRNAGAIYVVSGEDVYLGKIHAGRFQTSRDCGPEQEARVIETLADPLTAATAYGKQYGICSCCGRTLTLPASIEAGIGPVCAGRFGW